MPEPDWATERAFDLWRDGGAIWNDREIARVAAALREARDRGEKAGRYHGLREALDVSLEWGAIANILRRKIGEAQADAERTAGTP